MLLLWCCAVAAEAAPTGESTRVATDEAAYTIRGATRSTWHGSNGIDYNVYVWRPDVAADAKPLPVLVVLDADYAFPIATSVVRHFVDRNRLPPIAVVGITHPGGDADLATYRRGRTRDYTPTHTLDGGYGPTFQKDSGGGPAFTKVLLDELLPALARRHALDRDDMALVGHSYGGLFAAHLLATRAGAFRRYVIVSPSLWYDGRMIFPVLGKAPAIPKATRVFLAVGGVENPLMETDLREYGRALEERGVTHRVVVYEGDTHDSVFPAAFTAGIGYVWE
jgi:predicted alpha/beta superfamily hydrolase